MTAFFTDLAEQLPDMDAHQVHRALAAIFPPRRNPGGEPTHRKPAPPITVPLYTVDMRRCDVRALRRAA